MTLRFLRIPAAFVFGTLLLANSALAQSRTSASASPYGGTTVEDIIARVNDQIITSSDYDRAMQELDHEERQRGATMQEMSEAHKDLLRNLIDQQLWLSKGKELGVTGETELINRLNDIRKQYNLPSLEALQKAAEQQGVSYEDFKANIRNQIITQDVMRDEVGRRISITPGEAEAYYEAHKQDYAQQESVRLSEILISTGSTKPSAADVGGEAPVDPQKLAQAEAKAADIEAKLHAGGNFSELAKSFSDGPTASEGGDLGVFRRGSLAKVLEDKVFPLNAGEYTAPIRTKQGFIILKVVQHTAGGVPPFKDVEQDVEQAYYMSKMEPAMRAYLSKMRDDAYIEIKPGYVDTGASPNKRVFPIAYSAYTPPAPKKKKKIERTRFRETARTFRQKSRQPEQALAPPKPEKQKQKKLSKAEEAAMRPGKKEKIRFGQAPQETLPKAASSQTEDAGALPAETTAKADLVPENPLEASAPPEKKSRFSDRARQPKHHKTKGVQKDPLAPEAPDAAEVADRQVQSAPLGLGGNTVTKKKKHATTTGEKTRLSDEKKKSEEKDQTPPGADQTPQAPAPTPQN
jgi:peptidyl-prolyl cis-trans isomerase SurA